MKNKSLIHITAIGLTVLATAVGNAAYASAASHIGADYATNSGLTAPAGKLFKRASDKDRKGLRGVLPTAAPVPTATPVKEPIKQVEPAKTTPVKEPVQKVKPVKPVPAQPTQQPKQEKIKPVIGQQSNPATSQPPPANKAAPGKNKAPSWPKKIYGFDSLVTPEELEKLVASGIIKHFSASFERETATTTTTITPKSTKTTTVVKKEPKIEIKLPHQSDNCKAMLPGCFNGITPPPNYVSEEIVSDNVIRLDVQPPNYVSEEIGVHENPKMTATDLNEEFLNEVRRSYQRGEGSDNIRSEEYLNKLTQAFHYIYNKLENRGALPSLGEQDGAINEHTPDFHSGSRPDFWRVDDFKNYPIVRGAMAENSEIAALSMNIKVEDLKANKARVSQWDPIYCGSVFQITMTNNGGSANQWTTRINPGDHVPKGTNGIVECLNAETPQAQTVFSKDPAADSFHVGRAHHPAMIEAIILMVLDGEAKNEYHRLSFWDYQEEPESLVSMRKLVLNQSGKKSGQHEGKLINEADFAILNY